MPVYGYARNARQHALNGSGSSLVDELLDKAGGGRGTSIRVDDPEDLTLHPTNPDWIGFRQETIQVPETLAGHDLRAGISNPMDDGHLPVAMDEECERAHSKNW